MRFKTSLFLFHRDLRLEDNRGLLRALEQSEQVILAFIFTPAQLQHNPYRSDNAVQFMLESLTDLADSAKQKGGRLYCFTGETIEVLEKIITSQEADAIFSNADYTPFSRKRDGAVEQLATKHAIKFERIADALLIEPQVITTQKGTPYTIYTPFKNKAKQQGVAEPEVNNYRNYATHSISGTVGLEYLDTIVPNKNKQLLVHGGRKAGIALLQTIKDIANYAVDRDIPALDATTHLSAHHKFGTISCRETYYEVFHHFGENHTLINELYWRDFFTHIGYHFPHVFTGAFHAKYDSLAWSKNELHFNAWCTGTTGFPIVDAGMRELNTTGYMHNRVRMVVASFLVKDVHIDWRKGEQYFAQKLVDYDPAVNNGNWQWAASTGCDAQPYFRIFNPWSQQKKFDPDCTYIYKWLPELANVPAKQLHSLDRNPLVGYNYPDPIVDHKQQSALAKELYKQVV